MGSRWSLPNNAVRMSGRARARRRSATLTGRFASHADLEIGRTIARVDHGEPLQEPVAQLLSHPFPTDEGVHPVRRPRKALPIALVEQVLDERRVAADQVTSRRSEDRQRGEDLRDVRPDRLHQAVPVHPERHVEAGRPCAHRECVEGHEVAGAKSVACKEGDVALRDRSFGRPSNPVVRRPRRAARLVHRDALEKDPTVNAPFVDRVRVDVGRLVRLRHGTQDPRRRETIGVDAGCCSR